jgi:predicted protein tyrosine phosphatase
MIEVYPNLFVGDEIDYELNVIGQEGWAVVHACKEPYHRQALGYRGREAPERHPERLVARRGYRLILNMVDARDPELFPKEMIDAALDFIYEALAKGLKVLVHCNRGDSRSPSIALLYMAARLGELPTESLEAAEEKFRTLYPNYNPKPGIYEHLRQNWHRYCSARLSSKKGLDLWVG